MTPSAGPARAEITADASSPGERLPAGISGGVTVRRRSPSDADLLELAGRLTERDRELCRILSVHRVLTTRQLYDIAFPTVRRAERRLQALHGWKVLDRFRPRYWSGSAPFHWLLGPAGAAVLAAEAGLDPAQSGWRPDTAAALARSQRLAHLIGVNGTFTSLIRAARTRPDSALAEWWSEARCTAAWGEVVRPDGYGVWTQDGARLPFLLEYDTGSERVGRLTSKLTGYERLAREFGHPTWVCFLFPTPGREAAARPALAHPTVPVATAVLAAGQDPSAAVWQPVGRGNGRRLPLIGLSTPTAATTNTDTVW